MQVVCTPLHLLALNLVNAPGPKIPWTKRAAWTATAAPAAFAARSLRMLPAYGVGGILNGYFVRRGRELALADAMREIEASESESETGAGSEEARQRGRWESAIEAFGSGERLDSWTGGEEGEAVLHTLARYLYGDNSVHPIAMAKETSLPEMTFRWERMIQNTVQAQLADAGGGDTIGGCIVAGGDAEVSAALDALISRAKVDARDGTVSVREIEGLLTRERDESGEGWAARALKGDERGAARSSRRESIRAAAAARGVVTRTTGAENGDEDARVGRDDMRALLRKRVGIKSARDDD
jgi:hypothetical protein